MSSEDRKNSEHHEIELEQSSDRLPPIPTVTITPSTPSRPTSAPARDRQRTFAKLRILEGFEPFYSESCQGLKKDQALELYAELYRQQELDLPKEVYQLVPSVSRTSLRRDFKILREQGIEGLGGGGYGNRKGQGLIDSSPELQEAIKGCLAASCCAWKPKQIRLALETQFEFEELPSEHQIRRWVKNFAQSHPATWYRLKNQDEFKSKLKPAFGKRDAGLTAPNQIWELDSSPTDLMLKVTDPVTGEVKKRRFTLVGCIDVYSRRCKFLVSESSKSDAILALLRDCILAWGIPDAVRTDNGKDYLAISTQAFLYDLGCKHLICNPHSPWEKPFIERVFKTFQHGELEMLPGFVGHTISDRAALRAHPDWNEALCELEYSPEEFQEWADKWCEGYLLRHHEGIDERPLDRITQAVAMGWKSRTVADPRQLDFLLHKAEERKVQRQGIKLNGRFYTAPELGGLMGQSVHCRFDPKDPRQIYVYDSPQMREFICTAQWVDAPEISPEEIAEIATKAQHEIKRATQADVKAARKQGKRLEKKIAEDPYSLVNVGNIKPLVREENYTNEALEAISEAMAPRKEPEIPELSAEEQQVHEERVKRLEEMPRQEPRERAAEKYHRLWLEAQSRALTEEERLWIQRFESTPQGRSMKALLEDKCDGFY